MNRRRSLMLGIGLSAAALAVVPMGELAALAGGPSGAAPDWDGDAGDTVLGGSNAPVTILALVSATCSHCQEWERSILPRVESELLNTRKAKLVLRDFPLDGPSLAAALMIKSMAPEARLRTRLAMQGNILAWRARAEAGELGPEARSAALFSKLETAQRAMLERRKRDSTQFSVRGTPTFVVGGRSVVGGQSVETLTGMVAAASGT